jgi:hypothetical protein
MNPDWRAKLQTANEHYEALLRTETDRATYLLATMVVDPAEPENSIADPEKLGEEKLRTIVTWLQNAKDNADISLDQPDAH